MEREEILPTVELRHPEIDNLKVTFFEDRTFVCLTDEKDHRIEIDNDRYLLAIFELLKKADSMGAFNATRKEKI